MRILRRWIVQYLAQRIYRESEFFEYWVQVWGAWDAVRFILERFRGLEQENRLRVFIYLFDLSRSLFSFFPAFLFSDTLLTWLTWQEFLHLVTIALRHDIVKEFPPFIENVSSESNGSYFYYPGRAGYIVQYLLYDVFPAGGKIKTRTALGIITERLRAEEEQRMLLWYLSSETVQGDPPKRVEYPMPEWIKRFTVVHQPTNIDGIGDTKGKVTKDIDPLFVSGVVIGDEQK